MVSPQGKTKLSRARGSRGEAWLSVVQSLFAASKNGSLLLCVCGFVLFAVVVCVRACVLVLLVRRTLKGEDLEYCRPLPRAGIIFSLQVVIWLCVCVPNGLYCWVMMKKRREGK